MKYLDGVTFQTYNPYPYPWETGRIEAAKQQHDICVAALHSAGFELVRCAAPLKSPVTSANDQPAYYLNTGLIILHERGQQYDITGNGERSFAAVATAFNAITGDNLKGSDVCLILQVLKDVRQYSDRSRIHADSLVDKVNYGALHAAELVKESK